MDEERLVRDYGKLVRIAARRYRGLAPFEDLVACGHIGLLKACRQFDPDRGLCFSTYAGGKIRGEMLHFLRDQSRMIRVPAWVQEKGDRECIPLTVQEEGFDEALEIEDQLLSGVLVDVALARLSPSQREIVEMRSEGLSLAQIARKRRTSASAVSVTLRRAAIRLHQLLREDDAA